MKAGMTMRKMRMASITEYLTNDHERLDRLLEALLAQTSIDDGIYLEFKQGLLQHIRFEETILLPAAREANGGKPLALSARLRLDHGALAALLVPPPTVKILMAIRIILNVHNRLEEGANGVYMVCSRLLANRSEQIISYFKSLPPIPLAKNPNVALAMESAVRAMERAGFSRALLDW